MDRLCPLLLGSPPLLLVFPQALLGRRISPLHLVPLPQVLLLLLVLSLVAPKILLLARTMSTVFNSTLSLLCKTNWIFMLDNSCECCMSMMMVGLFAFAWTGHSKVSSHAPVSPSILSSPVLVLLVAHLRQVCAVPRSARPWARMASHALSLLQAAVALRTHPHSHPPTVACPLLHAQ